tara:strand:- start:368 stop:1189 length:822 start_codon:yes stop_codon:yes gene_type:complete
MKKYLVIGNPIEHSLSPKLHNNWLKENNIDAVYEKKLLTENGIKEVINEVKNEKINGINVTVPFKKTVIPFIDELTSIANKTQSVNTIFKKDNKIFGDNTDVGGFEHSLKHINYSVKNKKIFILGAGGVTSSIIFALTKLGAIEITLSNRTREKAENLKKKYSNLKVIDWGELPNFDSVRDFNMIINTTSLGLSKLDEKVKINYAASGSDKKPGANKLFYDVIYNPKETNFLSKAREHGAQTENGKMMFIYQAQLAFKIWHNILPKVNNKLLD